jgi:hypothetical protein
LSVLTSAVGLGYEYRRQPTWLGVDRRLATSWVPINDQGVA